MNFGKTPCKDRLNYLREEYKFDCSCQACTFDWPLLEDTNAATLPKLRRNRCVFFKFKITEINFFYIDTDSIFPLFSYFQK